MLDRDGGVIGVMVKPVTLAGAVESPGIPDAWSERIPIFADVSTGSDFVVVGIRRREPSIRVGIGNWLCQWSIGAVFTVNPSVVPL